MLLNYFLPFELALWLYRFLEAAYMQKHQLQDFYFFVTLNDMLQVLAEEYGSGGVAHQGVELLLTTLSKIFGSLQVAYEGNCLGCYVIL